MRILCDVDGVVADLMGGFCEFIASCDPLLDEITVDQITHHKLGKSPALGDRGRDYYESFLRFMECNPYFWVPAIRDSIQVIRELAREHEFLFVTATMKSIPDSYASKARWLEEHGLGHIPVCSVPSEEKHNFRGDIAIDDRLDICHNYRRMGTQSILFFQPWSVSDSPLDLLDEEIVVCDPHRTEHVTSLMPDGRHDPENTNLSAWQSIASVLRSLG